MKNTNAVYEVTLKQLRVARACYSGYNRLVRALQGKAFTEHDEDRESYISFKHTDPIKLTSIIESNGLDDALWCLKILPDHERDARLFAIWCARQVQQLMTDERSIKALDVAERYANGGASESELNAARDAAWDAKDAARAARGAAWAAARDAAWAAARAARDAAWAAARAARDAGDAARDAARAAQKEMFIKMCNGTAPWQK